MKRVLPVAILFLLLLGLVVAKEIARARIEGGGADTEEYVPLSVTKFAAKDAARIEVTAPGASEPAYVLERDDGTWRMTKPFRAPAHLGNADKLCEALAAADAEPRTDDAGALRDVDLVPERAVAVRVTAADGKPLAHVAVGRTTGASGAFIRFLAQPSDVRAFETTSNLRGLLGLGRSGTGDAEPEKPAASYFRDCAFPQVALDKPKRIELTAPGRRVVLEKSGEEWKAAEGGPGAPVNQDGVKQLLQRFGPEFRAKDLADPADLAKLGLAEPKWTLAVVLEDGSVKRVSGAFDAAKDTWYARLDAKQDPDVVFEATSWEGQRLFPAGSSLFTFEGVDLPDDRLSRVVVETGAPRAASRIEMTRDGTKPGDDWKLVLPDWPLVPRQSSLRSLGSSLRSVRPTDWADAPDIGPVEVTVRAGKKDAPEEELTVLRFGGKAPSGKDRLASLPKREGHAFVVPEATVDRLAVAPLTLFEPKVLHGWAEADLKAVRVETRAGDAWAPSFAAERGDKGWEVVEGEARAAAKDGAMRKWLAALLAVEAREVAAGDAASAADETRLTIERQTGATSVWVLSAPKDGRRTVTLGTLRFPADGADLVPAPASLK